MNTTDARTTPERASQGAPATEERNEGGVEQTGTVTAEGGHGAIPTGPEVPVQPRRPAVKRDWPLYEVFVRGKRGLNHVHVGSLHAPDDEMAIDAARDLYTRRNEGVSIWVVKAADITASSPDEKDPLFAPSGDKVYRHPTFYEIPEDVPHM
ncbi:1,2-phenylacetyl-CoA epoxidase subunit PaaB [Geodermatophilus sp. URMC 61]|uniref:1,2-phenylacetyl-CoA epoxidase subunit PaaB n=1 Tax=Geodermatophilus sp. URMC 61 TaxID=3423411 RepID=UPI00406C4C6C